MSGSGDKTEKPSATRLRKSRERGDIPRPKDLGMAVGLIASLVTLSAFIPYYQSLIHGSFIALRRIANHINDDGALHEFMLLNVLIVIKVAATLVPIPVSAALANLIPGGWVFVLKRIIPDVKKLSPIASVKRLVSRQNFVDVLKMILKSTVLLAMLALTFRQKLPDLLNLESHFLRDAIVSGLQQYGDVMQRFVIIIALFAFIDVPLSKFMFINKLRMTKKELRDESKNQEGNPQIKGRIRQLQRLMAMGLISNQVSEADVVIMNPTHCAVALKYSPEKAAAPFIVAKGRDEIALYIRSVAQKHKIEVVEFPSLARSIYHSTRVNQQIPASLYRPMASILSYVMQLKTWRQGTGEKPRLDRQIPVPAEGKTEHVNV